MPRLQSFFRSVLLLLLMSPLPAAVDAQEPRERPRLFLDCGPCDRDYTRTEITFVDFVLDRAVADIHLLVTTQTTGSGGREYTLNFIGLGRHAAQVDTLRYFSSPDATSDIVRQELTRTIKLGLAPFVAQYPIGRSLEVSLAAGGGPPPERAAPEDDPWNFWVFRIGLNTNLRGEESAKFEQYGVDISATRVTEEWKIQVGIDGFYNEQRYDYEDFKSTSINRNSAFDVLVAKSLGAHVSAGIEATVSSSTFGNQSLFVRAAPGIEYNFFDYAESTRRQLTVLYTAGANYYDYREITLLGEIEETRPQHVLRVGYSTRQPWGSANLSVSGSQFLHDTEKYRLSFGGSASFRIFRGLDFSFGGTYSKIRDQISVAAGEATEEEILLRLRQLTTGYSYFTFARISYRFGSIFSNVVNPRFRSSGGGEVIFF